MPPPLFPQYYAPWATPRTYYMFSTVLSSTLLISLCLLSLIFRKFEILPPTFPGMMRAERGRLLCFEVDITYAPERRGVERNGLWVLRTAVVVIFCYIWQSLVLNSKTYSLTGPYNTSQMLAWLDETCGNGFQCVASEKAFHWLLFDNPQPLCVYRAPARFPPSGSPMNPVSLVCLGFPKVNGTDAIRTFGVSYALFHVVLTFYRTLSWMVFRSRSDFVQRAFFVVAVLLFVGYCCVLAFATAFFVNDWLITVSVLSLPVLLLAARGTGYRVRKVRNAQLASLLSDAYQENVGRLESKLRVDSGDLTLPAALPLWGMSPALPEQHLAGVAMTRVAAVSPTHKTFRPQSTTELPPMSQGLQMHRRRQGSSQGIHPQTEKDAAAAAAAHHPAVPAPASAASAASGGSGGVC